MGTRTAAYRDGRVIFIRAAMDEALAKFIADAIIVVRDPPPIVPPTAPIRRHSHAW